MCVCVCGGGGGGVTLFLGQFFRATIFCVGFFQFTNAFFWVYFTNICIFFAVYYAYFIERSKQCFGHKIFLMYN